MTEYELLDLLASVEQQMAVQFSLYLSVVSAYMIVAYLVGSKLSNVQVIIASVLMIFTAGGQTWGMYKSLMRAMEYLAEKSQLYSLTKYEEDFAANTYVWIVILSAGVLASLYFMWSVRHAKNE